MRQNFAEAENDDTDGDHIGHSAKLGGNSVNQRDDCQTYIGDHIGKTAHGIAVEIPASEVLWPKDNIINIMQASRAFPFFQYMERHDDRQESAALCAGCPAVPVEYE